MSKADASTTQPAAKSTNPAVAKVDSPCTMVDFDAFFTMGDAVINSGKSEVSALVEIVGAGVAKVTLLETSVRTWVGVKVELDVGIKVVVETTVGRLEGVAVPNVVCVGKLRPFTGDMLKLTLGNERDNGKLRLLSSKLATPKSSRRSA